MGLLLHLASGAVLDIVEDKLVGIGWPGRRPTEEEWQATKAEVERLLGCPIVTWGAFINPSTGVWWTELARAEGVTDARPSTPRLSSPSDRRT